MIPEEICLDNTYGDACYYINVLCPLVIFAVQFSIICGQQKRNYMKGIFVMSKHLLKQKLFPNLLGYFSNAISLKLEAKRQDVTLQTKR
jgi:hypothetical protein